MSFTVLGIGTAVSPTAVTREEGERMAQRLSCRTDEHATWLPSLYGQLGIGKRHLCHPRAVVRDMLDGAHLSGSAFVPTEANRDCGPSTGERMRYYQEHAVPLAVRASLEALGSSGLARREITHIVTVSC